MTQTGWTWAVACRRGVSHEKANVRLQDAFKCFIASAPSNPIVIVVSDGAGTAPFGGEGASLICRALTVCTRQYFSAVDTLPTDDLLASWLKDARELVNVAASRRNVDSRDFAATLIFLISSGAESVVLHVGDGCAVLRDEETSSWIAPVWPFHGEYASTTAFVTDDPSPEVCIVRHLRPITAISVFSDGLERLALDLRARRPFAPFFDSIIAPVAGSDTIGKDGDLSGKLNSFLGSDSVNSRSDDDKTLILAVRR
ncbi:MAG TPA: PP2C family serine/threonine-protein phosphatase [Acidobacteriaceae bacterium]